MEFLLSSSFDQIFDMEHDAGVFDANDALGNPHGRADSRTRYDPCDEWSVPLHCLPASQSPQIPR